MAMAEVVIWNDQVGKKEMCIDELVPLADTSLLSMYAFGTQGNRPGRQTKQQDCIGRYIGMTRYNTLTCLAIVLAGVQSLDEL